MMAGKGEDWDRETMGRMWCRCSFEIACQISRREQRGGLLLARKG